MNLNSHIFKLLLSFCSGIILIYYFQVHWIVLFTLWATSLITLLTLIHFGRQLVHFRKWIGVNLLIVFFLSGSYSYQYSLASSQRKHFSHYFLEGDHIFGLVQDANRDSVGYRKVIVEVNAVHRGHEYFNTVGRLLCYVKSNEDIRDGDIFEARPKINPIVNNKNPGEFDAEGYWRTKGVEYLCFLRNHNLKIHNGAVEPSFWIGVREKFKTILEQFLSPENKQVAQALVLGDKSELSQEKRSEYANAGAMHVLAVSGMHVGILLGFLQWFFYRIKWIRKRGYFIVAALLMLWCFAFLTGLSASVLRATIMFTVLSIGQLRGYSFFSLNALFVAAFAILFIDPKALFSIGFQLSFLAMLGIAFFFEPFRSLINSRSKALNYLWDGTALGMAAQVGTIPISLYYFHQFPNYFLITNLGLIVLAGAAMVSVVVLLLLFWLPFVGNALGYIVDLIFTVLNAFISWINDLPGTISKGYDPSLIWVMLTYLCVIGIIYFWNRKRMIDFRFSFMGLFLCGVFLIYGKLSNYYTKEMVVLNSSAKVVLVKKPGVVLCFYEQGEIDQKRLEFMVGDYVKIMQGEIIYTPLSVGQTVDIDKYIKIGVAKSLWKINYHQYKVDYSRSFKEGVTRKNPDGFDLELKVNTKKSALVLSPSDKQF